MRMLQFIKIFIKSFLLWCLVMSLLGLLFRWIGVIGDEQLNLMLTFLVPVSGLMFVGITIATVLIKK